MTRSSSVIYVIGAQRAGTTALYKYLVQHPGIAERRRKELDELVALSAARYPLQKLRDRVLAFFIDSTYVDATPFSVMSRKAIDKQLRIGKCVFIYRDPLERLLSQYKMNVSKGFEIRSLKDAVQSRESFDRLSRRYGYVARSLYCEQLGYWQDAIENGNLLVVSHENLLRDPVTVMRLVFKHVGISDFSVSPIPYFENYCKQGKGFVTESVPLEIEQKLQEDFALFQDKYASIIC